MSGVVRGNYCQTLTSTWSQNFIQRIKGCQWPAWKKSWKTSKVDTKECYQKSKQAKRKQQSAPRASYSSNKQNQWFGKGEWWTE